MKPAGIHHLAIKTRDVERCGAFYREVLGLTEDRRHEDTRGLRSIWFRTGDPGGSILMIERSETGGTGAAPPFASDPAGLHLLALAIPRADREAWRAHLIACGHEIAAETPHTLYTRDPDGNRIGLCALEI